MKLIKERADRQCKAVYAWEMEWVEWNKETLSLVQARRYIAEACRVFGVDKPAVRQHKSNEDSITWTPTSILEMIIPPYIDLNADHKNPAICLHEAAHHICFSLHGNRPENHGPTWLGIYLALLILAKVAPKEALYATARKHKLRWVMPSETRSAQPDDGEVNPHQEYH